MKTPNPLKTLLASIMAMPMLLLTPASHGQFGGAAGIADAFRADFLARDMQLFVEQLRLEDWQRPIIEMLFEDYRTAFDGGVERVREEIQTNQSRIVEARPEQVMEIILEPISAWDVERRALREQFLNNVKAQLSGEQLKRWPRFQRTLRRDKELSKGELDGESIDLYVSIRQMRMPYEVEETIDPLLVDYEIELDDALIARAAKIDSLQEELKEAMTRMDYDAGLRAQDQIMAARTRVRAIQDVWIDRLADAIPTEYATEFRSRALAEAYPRAFRPTIIPKMFDKMRDCADLSNDQIDEFNMVEDQFDVDMTNLEMEIVASIRSNQPAEARRRVERLIEQKRTGKRDRTAGPTDELLAKKKDLIEQTKNRINGMLTPEQNAECMKGLRTITRDGKKVPHEGRSGGRRSWHPLGDPPPDSVATPNFRPNKPEFNNRQSSGRSLDRIPTQSSKAGSATGSSGKKIGGSSSKKNNE